MQTISKSVSLNVLQRSLKVLMLLQMLLLAKLLQEQRLKQVISLNVLVLPFSTYLHSNVLPQRQIVWGSLTNYTPSALLFVPHLLFQVSMLLALKSAKLL